MVRQHVDQASAWSSTALFLTDRLHELGIPITANLLPAGTHAWTYWPDDVHLSWPLFA